MYASPPLITPATNWFLEPLSLQDSLRRPIGTGAQYSTTSDPGTIAWMAWSGANFNAAPGAGWGCVTIEGLPSYPLQTITRRPGAGTPFTYQVRHPDNLETGPDGTDRAAIFYEQPSVAFPAGRWFESWRHDNELGPWYSSSMHVRLADDLGYSPASRGICASGISIVNTIIRQHQWLAVGGCRHALGIAVPSKPAHGSPQILSPAITWPATNTDNSGAQNTGAWPYGQRLAIVPPERGGVDPSTLPQTLYVQALYWTLVNYGAVLVDQSAGIALRCDQTVPEAMRQGLIAAWAVLHDYLRAVTNVSAADAATGGGAPRV